MSFNLNDFNQTLQNYGYLSINKFDVNISMPNVMTGIGITGVQYSQLLNFRAESVRLPSIAFASVDTHRYGVGPITKQPVNAFYGDTQMTFLCDKKSQIYQFFYSWMNQIYNFSEITTTTGTGIIPQITTQPTYATSYEDDIVSEVVTINQYDQTGNITQTTSLYRVKPILLAGNNISWEQTDTLLKLTVALTFKEFSISYPNLPQ